MNTKQIFSRKITNHFSDQWFLEFQIQPLVISILVLSFIGMITIFVGKPLVNNYLATCCVSVSTYLLYTLARCYAPLKDLAREVQQEFDLLEQAKGHSSEVVKKSKFYASFSLVLTVILSLNINLIIASILNLIDIHYTKTSEYVLIFGISLFIIAYRRVYLLPLFEKRGQNLAHFYRPNF